MALGVVPQSSCSLRPMHPALDLLLERLRLARVALTESPKFNGNASSGLEHARHVPGPGVHVVAHVPAAGPVPPPIIVVTPDMSASSHCCGQMKWMCESMPPAVAMQPSPAMISVPGPITIVTPG